MGVNIKTPQLAKTQRVDPQRSTPGVASQVARFSAGSPIHQLQRAVGNRVLNSLLRSPIIQPKLTVSHPDDPYEREADRVADQVMRMPETPGRPTLRMSPSGAVHRKCACAAASDASCECEREPRTLQRSAVSSAEFDSVPQSVTQILRSSGRPLDGPTRAFMEHRFGYDFSAVRIHIGREAAASAQSVNAHAYTLGHQVVLGANQYQPATAIGRRLLAHELTHVVQQNGEGMLRKCKDCEAQSGKDKERLIQTKVNTSAQNYLQRVHIENGRKKFDCSDLSGDSKLEACLNDEDRLRPFDTGASVTKIQLGLQKDGQDLGEDGTLGVYGAATGQAVMAFKRKHNLGSSQFPDVGPGTTRKLDELCVGSPKPVTPKDPKPKSPDNCGPGTLNPFCLPIPAADAPCQPFPDVASAEVLRNNMSIAIPLLTAADTQCSEVKPVWETYFAATSKPFPFSNASSCVVNAAKTDREASAEANRIAKGHLEDILDNLPITLRDVTLSPFPFPGKPLAERRMPLEDAISLKLRGFLHHQFTYNDKRNAAANIAGGTGVKGEGSDIFGDDDRLFGGPVIIEVNAIDPTSGRMIGQVRWQPHIHVKDTVDFCPGNLTNSIILREFTVPMSKLEAMGLTRDVPITIDYDLDVQQANFSVLPLFGPLPSNP